MIRATNSKTGSTGQFSERDWLSGVPQRAGWVREGMEQKKTMPKDIIDFAFKKKPVIAESEKPEAKPEVKSDIPEVITESKIIKANDNPKQTKRRTTGRKPGRVAKT